MSGQLRGAPDLRPGFCRRGVWVGFLSLALAACGGGGGGGGGGGQQQQNNAPPSVNAGVDQTIALPDPAQLAGGATDPEGATLSFTWSSAPADGVAFANANAASTTVTFTNPGAYTLTLTASDGVNSPSDTVTITVQPAASGNTAPAVDAGADQTIQLPTNTAQLSGAATDAEADALTYEWTGSPEGVTFADAAAASTTATFPAAGQYTLTLTANDGQVSASDTVVITVQDAGGGGTNRPPVVSAGVDYAIQLPTASIPLSGVASDPDGDKLTYQWSTTDAGVTIARPAFASTTATFTAAGTYTLTLTVNDGVVGASDSLTVVVHEEGASVAFYPAPDLDESLPDRGWARITPAEAGMDAARLTQAQTYATTGPGGVALDGSGMIVKGGRLVHSWGDIDLRFPSQSATKSIGGIALGLALDDGLLALSDPAINSIPTLGDPPGSDDPDKLGEITVLQLATHTAGFPKDGGFWALQFDPGTTWSYSDGGLNWLADALTTEFGQDLHVLTTQRVWATLGINRGQLTNGDDVVWRNAANGQRPDPRANGIEHRELASGMLINANAMARVGLLFLRNGVWATGRILSESFVNTVRTPPAEVAQTTNADPVNFPGATTNYGVLWWTNAQGLLPDVPRDAYWAWGQGESLVVVIPSLDLVIARIGRIVQGAAAQREWGESNWNADYAVLEPFLNPIVCAAGDPLGAACD